MKRVHSMDGVTDSMSGSVSTPQEFSHFTQKLRKVYRMTWTWMRISTTCSNLRKALLRFMLYQDFVNASLASSSISSTSLVTKVALI
jgi:hypothetical protein